MRRIAFILLTGILLSTIPQAVAPSLAQPPTPGTSPTAAATATGTTTPVTMGFVLWVPIAVRNVGGDDSGIQVQNTGTTAAILTIDYYYADGNRAATSGPHTVQPSNPENFYQPNERGLPSGFDGSAVIRSSQPIAAIVNRVNYTAGSSTSSLTVPSSPNTSFYVPLVYGGRDDYFTTLSIQNTSPDPATYTLNLQPNAGTSGAAVTETVTVAPNAVRRLRVGTDIRVAGGFIGAANITGPQTLIAVGETRNTRTGVWFGYSGVPTGSATHNAPLLFKNYDSNQWMSGAQVANTSNATITLNATVRSRDDVRGFALPAVTLAPNQGHFYDLSAAAGLPENLVGSGVFTATGPIAVVVQETSAPKREGMAYNGFADGSVRISLPLIFKDFNGYDTGVQVQNLGTLPTTVTISFFSATGLPQASQTEVANPGGDAVNFYQPTNPALPTGFVGSATVTSDGQPIVAIVNQVNYLRTGDAGLSYEGIN